MANDVRRHKDTNFWKQFTTKVEFCCLSPLMFAVTKIQIFESNSQLHSKMISCLNWCSPSQRYKFLKAIHNSLVVVECHFHDVRRHKDTNFWKQFTTTRCFFQIAHSMFAVTKIQIFESNSQHFFCGCYYFADVRRHKDTNFWKQFTTIFLFHVKKIMMFAVTKIQIFESNSQPTLLVGCRYLDVRRHKDTNFWKQFTTKKVTPWYAQMMFAVTKIQIFESNSQPWRLIDGMKQGCSPSQRYKFLKAIHN